MARILADQLGPPRRLQMAEPARDPREDAVLRAAGERLLLNMASMAEEAKTEAQSEARRATEEQAARAKVEERLAEVEAHHARLTGELEAANAEMRRQATELQGSIGELRASSEHLRSELLAKDAEATTLREEAARAAAQHRKALEEATAAIAAAAAASRSPEMIYQAPVKPEKVDFEYRRGVDGLLKSVVLKAAGYDDVTVDIERGGDNRMRQLKVKGV